MRQDQMMSIEPDGRMLLMTGNEAMARGAIEAGLSLAAGYPGTPSSEILENLAAAANLFGMYVEWSTNEKVAFETAYGASMTGLRSLVTMKHEGGNVIVDSLSKMVYTGVKGGFLVITCDDPGALSSSNEQDNRFFAQFVDMPVFEPSSPQEAKDMVCKGFEISETFSLPIMIRSVTRLSHGKSKVSLGNIRRLKRQPFFDRHDQIQDRWFCCAFNHLVKHRQHHAAMDHFRQNFIQGSSLNWMEGSKNAHQGIITGGIAYNYVKEALRAAEMEKQVSLLKVGVPYPLDEKLCTTFLKKKERVLVIEESDPFMENQIRILAQVRGLSTAIRGQVTGDLERPGEMTFERVYGALRKVFKVKALTMKGKKVREEAAQMVNPRPLTMCPGCPHRGTHMALMKALKKLKVRKPIIFGDIGCYELGHEPPFDDMDSIYNMGAGVGLANGVAHSRVPGPVVALIGDSTLLHAGLPGFTNAVHNQANIKMIVFDNATIAMTGHQASINSTRSLMGQEAPAVDIAGMLKAARATFVAETDAFDVRATQEAIEKALLAEGPSAVVVHGPCALEHDRIKRREGVEIRPYEVDQQRCIGCKICTHTFGCPALTWLPEEEKVSVDPFVCNGCGVCVQICPKEAFVRS